MFKLTLPSPNGRYIHLCYITDESLGSLLSNFKSSQCEGKATFFVPVTKLSKSPALASRKVIQVLSGESSESFVRNRPASMTNSTSFCPVALSFVGLPRSSG